MSPKSDGSINAFAVANSPTEYNSQASRVFGKTYGDFLSGFFWSRDWVEAGADENTMIGNYPVLLVQNTELSVSTETAGDSNQQVCGSFQIVVAAPLTCDNCGYEYNSVQDVEDLTFAAISGIMSKLAAFNQAETGGLYSYTDGEGIERTDLFTDEMLAYLLDEEIITDTQIISGVDVGSDYSFQRWGEGTKDKLIGWVVTADICLCENVSFPFQYNVATWKKAITKCATCP